MLPGHRWVNFEGSMSLRKTGGSNYNVASIFTNKGQGLGVYIEGGLIGHVTLDGEEGLKRAKAIAEGEAAKRYHWKEVR